VEHIVLVCEQLIDQASAHGVPGQRPEKVCRRGIPAGADTVGEERAGQRPLIADCCHSLASETDQGITERLVEQPKRWFDGLLRGFDEEVGR